MFLAKNSRKNDSHASVQAMVAGMPQPLDPPQYVGEMVLVARLGEGGMATVFLGAAGQGELARPAAIKLLKRDLPDHDYTTRFLDEAKIVVHLHHNNIVDVRAAGEHDGQLYIAMECIEGRDLADVWDRCAEVSKAFPVPLAVHIVREVLRGLHYAHTFPGLGLVHRDVSPSNVLVDWSGAVRLADFGLATSTIKASMTLPGVVFGKVGYMSPEQARREPLDGRADVYACGVMLWELLTGRPMREGADLTTARVAQEVATPPSALSRRLDAVLDGIVIKAISHDRETRYESAAAMLEDLGAWLGNHAPQTTQERVADFMGTLYEGQAEKERTHRDSLLERVRSGAPLHRRRQPERVDTDELDSRTLVSLDSNVEAIPDGYVIAERYEIAERLGKGGMGTVYLAEHLTVGRQVAVKVLTREWSDNPSVARRFRAEARAASAAGHSNIVEVFDAGELPDGRLFLVMERLDGRNLYEEIDLRGPMEVARACRVLRDIVRAIRAAHEVGVIHRDLKPDNVMLARRGRDGDPDLIKVLDFGISASTDKDSEEERLTMPGSALGTPEYMAPEQCRGEVATEKFDIYAIGVIFFEVLVGNPPFQNESFVEVMAQKGREPAPPVSKFRKDVPVRLAQLIADCLEIDPADRPESAKVVLERLEEVLRRMPRPVSGPISIASAVSRTRRIVAGTIGAGLAAALALWISGDRAPTPLDGASEIAVSVNTQQQPETASANTEAPGAMAAELAAPTPAPPAGDDLSGTKKIQAPTAGTGASLARNDEEIMADAASGAPASSGVGPGSGARKATPTAGSASTRPRVAAAETARCRSVRGLVEDNLRASRYTRAYENLDATCWSSRTSYYAIKARLLYELNQDEKCIRVGTRSSAASVEKWVGRCRMRAGK